MQAINDPEFITQRRKARQRVLSILPRKILEQAVTSCTGFMRPDLATRKYLEIRLISRWDGDPRIAQAVMGWINESVK